MVLMVRYQTQLMAYALSFNRGLITLLPRTASGLMFDPSAT
jgi:hypothetical protein